MLVNILLGCLIFFITNSCLLYASHLLVRRFFSNLAPAARLIALGVLYYAFIILIFQALSPLHAIARIWVTLTCILIASIAHFTWGKQRDFSADIDPLRAWLRDGLDSRWAVLIIVCGFVVLFAFSRALLMPPLVYDCVTYHLTFAAMWIKQGTLFLFKAPDQIIDCAYFPINGELFASWLLLPFHHDLLANTMNFPLTLLGGIGCYAIAREFGMTRKEASFAPALICFAPMIFSQITTALVDNASLAFYAASVLFILRYLRTGYLPEGLLAVAAAGILVGIKHAGIPVLGLVFMAFFVKLIRSISFYGFFRKCGMILVAIFIIGALGGRQYILNTIDAGNPLYPFSVELFQTKLLEGSAQWKLVNYWISEHEKEKGLDKYSLWEKEYRKLLYLTITIGPKFLTFLMLAIISLVFRPRTVPAGRWRFLALLWLLPMLLFYADTDANAARKGPWIESSSRFLSPYVALFTIMGLAVIKRFSHYFKGVDFLLVALIVWDLLYINKTHLWEVEAVYPFIVLIIMFMMLLFTRVGERLKRIFIRNGTGEFPALASGHENTPYRKWIIYSSGLLLLVAGLYVLQCYRDATRYKYYSTHSDHQGFVNLAKSVVGAWEFLDQPGTPKTIAMTMGPETPLGYWLLYPVLGRRLQNDVVYVSAKSKWEVPAWVERGLLRGDDFSIWLYNLKRLQVNYIMVSPPWPIELAWISRHEDEFELIFSDVRCRIYSFTGDRT